MRGETTAWDWCWERAGHIRMHLRPEQPRPLHGADRPFFGLAVTAIMVGLVFVLSATFPPADGTSSVSAAFGELLKQTGFAALGLGLMVITTYGLGARRAVVWSFIPFAVSVGLMILCRYGPYKHPVNGAYCWVDLPLLPVFQPSEFAKFAYIAFLAGLMSRPLEGGYTFGRMVAGCLGAFAVMAGLLLIQKDLGMTVLFVGVTLVMLFLRGVHVSWLVALALILAAGGLHYAHKDGKRWDRLTVFLHPTADPDGKGYHACQMLATLARGGLLGTSLGMSEDKWGGLPYPDTDSIFDVIGGEMGILGVVGVVALFFAMTCRSLEIARRSSTAHGWFLASGVGVCLGLQALIHMGVATASLPCTGITLPFVSYGGSSMLASLIAAGLVLAVSRTRADTPPEGSR